MNIKFNLQKTETLFLSAAIDELKKYDFTKSPALIQMKYECRDEIFIYNFWKTGNSGNSYELITKKERKCLTK